MNTFAPSSPLRRLRSHLLAAALCLLPCIAWSFSPVITKIHGRSATDPGGDGFGAVLSMNQTWMVAGHPDDDDKASNAGAAHIYNISGSYYRKLKASDGVPDDHFGAAVGICGNLIAIGAPFSDDGGTDAGAVYLFSVASAASSRHLVKLVSPTAAPGELFGSSVAFSGSYLVVGAPRASGNKGAIYVYPVSNLGAVTPAISTPPREITATGGLATDGYGHSVAAAGRIGVVGAPYRTPIVPGPLAAGVVFVVDLQTGDQLWELHQSTAAAGDSFGWAVATDGRTLIAGAPNASLGPFTQCGTASLFDIATGTETALLTEPTGGNGIRFGSSVALNNHLAMVGAPGAPSSIGTGAGTAVLFELGLVNPVNELVVPGQSAGDALGSQVALFGNLALVSASGDDDQATDAGSAYLFDPVNGRLAMRMIMRSGDFAEGIPGGLLGPAQSSVINPLGMVSVTSLIGGLGNLPGGTFGGVPAAEPIKAGDTAVWSTGSGKMDLLLRSRDVLTGGEKIGGLGTPIFNQTLFSVFQAKLSGGTGVTAANNQIIFGDDGTSVDPIIRTGTPVGAIGNASISTFQQVVEPRGVTGEVDLAYKLKTAPGPPVVNASNDTGVMALLGGPVPSVADATAREGNAIPGSIGSFFRQTMGRVTGNAGKVCSPTYVSGSSSTPAQALVTSYGLLGWTTSVFQGHPAFGAGGSSYGGMLGETISDAGKLIYRASLTGLNSTAKNNEGLFRELTGLLVRKGDEPDAIRQPGVFINRFINIWPGPSDQVIFLAALAGVGVNPANDQALFVYQENGQLLRLLREGDLLGTPDAVSIAAISRVDVDSATGCYVVLAALKSASNSNQALLTGCTTNGNSTDKSALRLPAMRIRKGTLYQSRPGYTARILSMAIAGSNTDSTGFGGKGLGQIINSSGQLTITIQFDNKVTEVMLGKP